MLFFKEIKKEKLASDRFKAVYERECHICRTTVAVSAAVCERADTEALLAETDMSPQQLADLIQGEHCNPRQVVGLCRHLGIDDAHVTTQCPRLRKPGKEHLTGQGKIQKGV